jgi:sortase A
MPGQLGNAAVAGHRTTYGAPFYDLDRLDVGDLIEIDTFAGHFVYAVTGSTVVPPSGYAAVIPTTDSSVATLTLATCTPRYSARDRLIVMAALVPEQSDQVMAPPSATVPPDPSSSVDTVPDTLPGESTPDTTTPDTTTPDTTTPTTAPTTTAPSEPGNGLGAAEDSFSQGWFDDASAIPQALVWGLVLVAVGVGAYFVGRSTRRLWVSFLVGFIPFMIVLYFFFENVNRLLPPSL